VIAACCNWAFSVTISAGPSSSLVDLWNELLFSKVFFVFVLYSRGAGAGKACLGSECFHRIAINSMTRVAIIIRGGDGARNVTSGVQLCQKSRVHVFAYPKGPLKKRPTGGSMLLGVLSFAINSMTRGTIIIRGGGGAKCYLWCVQLYQKSRVYVFACPNVRPS